MIVMPATVVSWQLLEDHLTRHLAENGKPDFFMVPQTIEDVTATFDPTEWHRDYQRAWVLLDDDNQVRGHAVVTRNAVAPHRCTLGMGVEEPFRFQGHGKRLMTAALEWADARGFDWVDGQALAHNEPVLGLDKWAGFIHCGQLDDVARAEADGHVLTFDLIILTRKRPT